MSRKTRGRFSMLLGAALILAALLLALYNRREDDQAGQASQEVLPEMQEVIGEPFAGRSPFLQEPDDSFVMTEVKLNGYDYIGYLSIPALELELPVMSQWSYQKLRIAPCRQFGTTRGKDLVIAGHNYRKHFGNIDRLTDADVLFFTDMDGEVTCYRVGTVDVISPNSTEEVENSPWDLVLYTCTYGGRSRIMVGANTITRDDLDRLLAAVKDQAADES